MGEFGGIDFGPLEDLIGVWEGGTGVDVAPEPDGTETNPYYETITYSAVGNVTNAESQNGVAIAQFLLVSHLLLYEHGCHFHNQNNPWAAKLCWLQNN